MSRFEYVQLYVWPLTLDLWSPWLNCRSLFMSCLLFCCAYWILTFHLYIRTYIIYWSFMPLTIFQYFVIKINTWGNSYVCWVVQKHTDRWRELLGARFTLIEPSGGLRLSGILRISCIWYWSSGRELLNLNYYSYVVCEYQAVRDHTLSHRTICTVINVLIYTWKPLRC